MDIQELNAIRELARSFAKKELEPKVEHNDKTHQFDSEAYLKLAKTKLPFVHFPTDYEGAASYTGLAIVAEELSRVDPGFVLSVMASSQLFGYNIVRCGNDQQRNRYLPALVNEGKLGCWALTEPDVGSAAQQIKTYNRKRGDSYLINGSKTFITNAPIADFFIVLTKDAEGPGGTAFVLERNHPGMQLSAPLEKMGNRTSPTGQIFFEDCEVPAEAVLGTPGHAFSDMLHSLDLERALFAAIPMGIMKECVTRARSYSQTRKQFGKPIADYQLIRAHLAEMVTQLEFVDAYFERVLTKLEAKENVHFEATTCKYLGSKFCLDVADRAIQILGGNGYMAEYCVERLYRDARLFPIGGGTSEIHQLILAKNLLGKRGELYA